MLHNKKKSRSLVKKIAVSSCTALRAFSKKKCLQTTRTTLFACKEQQNSPTLKNDCFGFTKCC
jgi:hypothetical protein